MRASRSPDPEDAPNAATPHDRPSKTQLKKASHDLQDLGEAVVALPDDRLAGLPIAESLLGAIQEYKRTRSHEGKRRQMQYIGKLMRGLDEESLQSVRDALDEQRKGSAGEALALHQAEKWRDDLIGRQETLQQWLSAYPQTDSQQLRALIRQARKDVQPDPDAVSRGLAPRQGRAYREIFLLVKQQLSGHDDAPDSA